MSNGIELLSYADITTGGSWGDVSCLYLLHFGFILTILFVLYKGVDYLLKRTQ